MRKDTMKVAVINCGSSSIKYEVFSVPDLVMLATGLIEKIGGSEGRLRKRKRNADGTFEEQVYSKRLRITGTGFEFMAEVNRENRIIQDESRASRHRPPRGPRRGTLPGADPDRR